MCSTVETLSKNGCKSLYQIIFAMDVSKSGALLEIDRLRPPKDIRTSILSSSYMEGESRVIHGLEMHDRFEQVFLASPRAQVYMRYKCNNYDLL